MLAIIINLWYYNIRKREKTKIQTRGGKNYDTYNNRLHQPYRSSPVLYRNDGLYND